MRLLFCVPTTALSGGVKIGFEIAGRLAAAGESVDLFSFAGPPRWCTPRVPLLAARDLEAVPLSEYDFVVVSNAFLLPMVLPLLGGARAIFFAQDYESFHHARSARFADFAAECPAMAALYRLPVPIIASSRAVQGLIKERVDRDVLQVPLAIDRTLFAPRPARPPSTGPARVLMVGNYLMPYKGVADGLEALARLARDRPVQLVLITQERRGRQRFDDLPFPVEVHYCPGEAQVPDIMAGCDVYCCASWYEGLGLPGLEAFACGVPVVSTRTYGVSDYGVDGVNLLLANPHDPADLSAKLATLLRDPALRERLRQGGFATMRSAYHWEDSVRLFRDALATIDATYRGAGAVDAAHMADLLRGLEQAGSFTPIAVFREFQALADALRTALRRLADGDPTERATIASLRDGFARYLGDDRTQYHDVFKAKYDLCRMVLALDDGAPVGPVIDRLLHPEVTRERARPAFSEIRYQQS